MKNTLFILILIVFILSCKNKKMINDTQIHSDELISQNKNENKTKIALWDKYLDTVLEKNNPKYLDLKKHQLFIDTTRNSKFYKEIIEWKPSEIYNEMVNDEIAEYAKKYELKKVSINNFPKKWVLLRKYKGEYVIYKPCDGKTFSFEITENSVIFHRPQEPNVNVISKLVKQTDDELVIELKTISRFSKNGNSKLSISKKELNNVFELIYSTDNSIKKYYVTPVDKVVEFDMIVNNCGGIKQIEFQGFDDSKKPLEIEMLND